MAGLDKQFNTLFTIPPPAIASEKIDEAKVEEARQRAEARLQEKLSDEEVASVNASLVRSTVQLRVKRRQRPG